MAKAADLDLDLDTLTLEQHGRVITARYASPPLNFVTTAFIRELAEFVSTGLQPAIQAGAGGSNGNQALTRATCSDCDSA